MAIFLIATALLCQYKVVYTDDINNTTTTKTYWFYESPDFEKLSNEHYNFIKWEVDDENDKETVWHVGTTKLIAKWEPKEYEIKFELGEDEKLTFPMDTYKYSPDEDIILPRVIKPHHYFSGWVRGESEEGITRLPAGSDQATSLKPTFEPMFYTINYNLNGGKISSDKPLIYHFGEKPKLPTPTREGYDFGGWYMTNGSKWDEFQWDKDVSVSASWKKKPVFNFPADYIVINNSLGISLTPHGTQADCDRAGNGYLGWQLGKTIIGDHRYQGFSIIEYLPIGTTAEVRIGGNKRTITLRSRYYGTNDKTHLSLYDGRAHGSIGDGDVILYTCQKGSAGRDVVITFWS